LPAGTEGQPSLYQINGREYLVVSATTAMPTIKKGDVAPPLKKSYVVYALPQKK